MFKFYRDNWYYVGSIIFAALAFFMGFWGHSILSPLQIILVYNFMALLAHQFEEYAMPGGAGLIINAVMYGERKNYERFPGNKLSMFLVNVPGAYIFYIAAIIFPDAIWYGLGVMFFGFFQLLGHGLVMNIRGRTFYNPGLITTLALFIPIGIHYICYVIDHNLITGTDYIYAAGTFILSVILILVLPIRSLMDRNSPYPMPAEEMSKFNMLQKLKDKGLVD